MYFDFLEVDISSFLVLQVDLAKLVEFDLIEVDYHSFLAVNSKFVRLIEFDFISGRQK